MNEIGLEEEQRFRSSSLAGEELYIEIFRIYVFRYFLFPSLEVMLVTNAKSSHFLVKTSVNTSKHCLKHELAKPGILKKYMPNVYMSLSSLREDDFARRV